MDNRNLITVEVVYLAPQKQATINLNVPENTHLIEAIKHSGILEKFPEIDLAQNKVGTFGKLLPLETPLKNEDRVEIYRPLLIDPKEKRLLQVKRERLLRACSKSR